MPRKAASKPTTQQATRTLQHLTPRELLAEIVGDARMAPGVLDSHWPMDPAALPHRDEHEIADMLGLPPLVRLDVWPQLWSYIPA